MIPSNNFVKFSQVSENVMHVYLSVELPIYISIIIVNFFAAIVEILCTSYTWPRGKQIVVVIRAKLGLPPKWI